MPFSERCKYTANFITVKYFFTYLQVLKFNYKKCNKNQGLSFCGCQSTRLIKYDNSMTKQICFFRFNS